MLRRQMLFTAAALASGAAVVRPPTAVAAPRRRAEIVAGDGTRLFHRDWGEGPAVVFAASWALSSEMWAYQVAHLADRGFRCIAFDRRGHGRSDVPAGGYDMDVFADDLAAVIDQLGLRDAALVGHSVGGAEVIHYLGRHGASKVRKAALLAPAAPYLVKTADNPYGAPRAFFDARLAEWGRDFPKWVEDNRKPFFTSTTSPAMEQWLVDQLLATPVPVVQATFRAALAKDLRPDLSKIDRPLLILHGDKDASAPVEITGQRIAAGAKGAELKVYPGAPHGLFVTHMDQVNADLERFLRA